MRILIILLIILLLCNSGLAQNSLPENLDSYVTEVMQTFNVPGVSVAIVKEGRILLAKGYGTKETGKNDPVDNKTLFGIASNTKAFTATAIAMLVEEGKLSWHGRVIDYLPEFRLDDPYVTREMQILDLLVHRSGLGLGAGDLLWWPGSTYNRKEIVARLRYLPLKTSFRSAYAYDNVLYTVAGEVIERVSGLSWEDFIRTRILDRIGMTTTDVRHSAGIRGVVNIASPHAVVEGKLIPVMPFTSDNVNPAGGIHSNASDMAKWMIVQLDSGRINDQDRLFSRKSAGILWSPVTPMPVPVYGTELAPLQMDFRFYAPGFNVQDYRGKKLVTHTGGLPGYVSRVAMIPSEKIGVTVLTNQESGAAFNAITYYLLDYYLKAPVHDWLAAYKTVAEENMDKIDRSIKDKELQRNMDSMPSLPLEKYAGMYRDAWYGDITIGLNEGQLVIEFKHTPELAGKLEHWQYDTFVVKWNDRSLRGDAFITFELDSDGLIVCARMEPFSKEVDFSFDFQDLNLKPVTE
jgi:CubicO group peptidase (beta-lactamase class C family)